MLKAKLIEEEPLKINLNVNYTTTKAEPAEGVLCLKGTVDTFESLPTENSIGDVYLVGESSPYNEYLWTGEAWEALAPKAEPMPDYVERSEFTHATESLKSELAGELSKVSELAPKSELESLKSDFETKLAGVSELVEKLKESGGSEGGSGGNIDFGWGITTKDVGPAIMGLVTYAVNLHQWLINVGVASVRHTGDKVTLPTFKPQFGDGGHERNEPRPMNHVTLIKTDKGYRMEMRVDAYFNDVSQMGDYKEYEEGRQPSSWWEREFQIGAIAQFQDLSYRLPFPKKLIWHVVQERNPYLPPDESIEGEEKRVVFAYEQNGYAFHALWTGEGEKTGSLSLNGIAYTEWEVDNA